MGCTTTSSLAEISLRAFIEFKNALDECDPEIQQVVQDVLTVFKSNLTSPEERQLAMHTIIDALYPSRAADTFADERSASATAEAKARNYEMDAREQQFADRVRQLMAERGVNQEELGAQMGVGQPAISNMLNRRRRPQRRTILRAAEALGVPPEDLWPEIADS